MLHSVCYRVTGAAVAIINYAAYWLVSLLVLHLFIALLPAEVSKPLDQFRSWGLRLLTKSMAALWKLLVTILCGIWALLRLLTSNRHRLKP